MAERIAGGIARVLKLAIPEIVLLELELELELDPDLAHTEPVPEIQHLIRASAGLILALDYLPGAVSFDAVTERPAAALASHTGWFDAFVRNVDRAARNTELVMWHRGGG